MGHCFIIPHPDFDRRYDEGGGERAIVDLLVEQIECADILVLNKMDQVDAEQKVALHEVTAALNRAATCMAVEHAKCEVRDILRPVAESVLSVADNFGDDGAVITRTVIPTMPHHERYGL